MSLKKQSLAWAARWAGEGQIWTHQTPPSGYPNEAAAEVVLTVLREWLEQHKDKVRMVGSEAGAGALSSGPTWPVGTCPPQAHSFCGTPPESFMLRVGTVHP